MHVSVAARSDRSSPSIDGLLRTVERRMTMLSVAAGSVTVPPGAHDAADAVRHHLGSGGQRIRARLALHTAQAVNLAQTDAVALATCAELLHNASLVHDDLQDRGTVRRGKPTVWCAFGDSVAICTGDLLLSAAYSALTAFSDCRVLPALIGLVHARTATAIHGQCADLSRTLIDLSDITIYEQIARSKSGALLSLPTEMALISSGYGDWAPRARQASESFAIGYQVLDDIEDFEVDGGTRDGGQALNAVSVLTAAGHGPQAFNVARGLGQRHLSAAIAAAHLLPNQCGSLLIALAESLADRLARSGTTTCVR